MITPPSILVNTLFIFKGVDEEEVIEDEPEGWFKFFVGFHGEQKYEFSL